MGSGRNFGGNILSQGNSHLFSNDILRRLTLLVRFLNIPRNINDCVAAVVQPSVCDRIVAQLDVLTGKQDDLLKNHVSIMERIDKSNEFLEGILKKP